MKILSLQGTVDTLDGFGNLGTKMSASEDTNLNKLKFEALENAKESNTNDAHHTHL